ncbi:Sodium/hydrogen exchanger family-domain-containing protein [Mrakia frigida]|uniref:Sodium/hydrogen exchanger family-domain-containing protein n=1 Tax=Mrakia frigida TaxID=29902 RepID=UPI003FCC1CB5
MLIPRSGGGGEGFHPFDVDAAHLTYTILGGFIVLFGMFSLFIKEKAFIGEAVIATLVGIIVGPYVTGGFDPRSWGGANEDTVNDITLEVTRVVIAISVFAVGVELPKAYMKKHWKSLAFLLGPVMVFGWFVSAALIYGIIPGLSFLSSLVIAACVTPTDPILAQAVIGGKFADKHVPAHLRHLLAAESGCNDGAAFPFLYIALYLILDASDAHAVGEWFYVTWLYEVALGITIGAILGYVARRLMRFCETRGLIDRQSFVAQYISLAMLSIGVTTLLGSDDLLAAFACGTAFAWDGFFNKQTEESNFSNVIDLLFNTTAFIYIGAILPFDQFNNHDLTLSAWRLIVLMISIMFLRRMPVILALYRWIPDIRTFREALFTGHFGPMGVGAIFISTLAQTKLPDPVYPPTNQVELLAVTIKPIVHFLVLCSVLIHGLSIPFFSLGRRVHSISRTHSIAFTRTNDSRLYSIDRDRVERPEPAWLSGMQRIVPGANIRINRDDDVEKGPGDREEKEIGLSSDSTAGLDDRGEGSSNGSGSGSSTRRNGVTGDKKKDVGGEEVENEEGGKMEGKTIGEIEAEGERREAQETGSDIELEESGRKTPPLREFRQGNHLIIERGGDDGADVEVEVVRNHFLDDKPSRRDSFRGPREGVAQDLKHYLIHVKEDVGGIPHEIKSALKFFTESSEERDDRLQRQDSRAESFAASVHSLRSNPTREDDESDRPKRRSGGGFSMMRTERIQVDSDEEAAVEDDDDEDEVGESSTHPSDRPKASYPPVSSSSDKKNKKYSPPTILVDDKPTGRKRDAIKKLFGGGKGGGSSSRNNSPPPSSRNAPDINLLSIPASFSFVPPTRSSFANSQDDSNDSTSSPASAVPSSVRFTDSPLTLTPTSTMTHSGLSPLGADQHFGHKRVSSLSSAAAVGGSIGRSASNPPGGLLMTPGEFNGPTGGPGVTFDLPNKPT